MPKRKTHTILLRVSAPADLSAADVRREVRTLINEQSNWSAEPEDIRAKAVRPAPRDLKG